MTPTNIEDAGLDPEVFRRAAEIAIDDWRDLLTYHDCFPAMNSPEFIAFDDFLTNETLEANCFDDPEHRALSLLLFAEMIESGDA